MSRPLVLYHADCADGFCSAWVANQALPYAEFVPVQYGQQPPDVTGRDTFILDFSFKKPVMIELSLKAAKLVCLDHHKTAAAELADLSAGSDEGLIRFDMAKSGGRLTWEYFFRGKPSPWLVDYSEDRDLWSWKLPMSKEINATLRSYPFDFKVWNDLAMRAPSVLAVEGSAILRYQQQVVETHCQHAVEIDMDGYKVLSLNATTMISEVGEKLAEGRPFSATWFIRKDGMKIWSLRSREGGIDVSKIAKAHGGGGHPQAAGFETSPDFSTKEV